MKIKDLIEILEGIEDKEIPVCLSDWNEQYMTDGVCNSATVENSKYLIVGSEYKQGLYLLLGIE